MQFPRSEFDNPARQAARYFAVVFIWSWGMWGLAMVLGLAADRFPGNLLMLAGALGPLLAGVLLTILDKDPAIQRDYWQRLVDLRRIPAGWYAILLLGMPGVTVLAILLADGAPGLAPFVDRLRQPFSLASFLPFLLVFGPLPEELGWRGYALDRLQTRWSALNASLALGALWAVWHWPLYLLPGTFQYGLGFRSGLFWEFSFGLIVISILMTWAFNNTARSTLGAILFHWAQNYSGELFAPTPGARWVQLVLLVILTVGVLLWAGPSRLTRPTPPDLRAIFSR